MSSGPSPGPSGGDLELETADGPARVEIKATAESAFQNFGEKDLKADVLVWVHFGSCFRDQNERRFVIYFLPRPKEIFPKPRKITLKRFLELGTGKVVHMEFDLEAPFSTLEAQPSDAAKESA